MAAFISHRPPLLVIHYLLLELHTLRNLPLLVVSCGEIKSLIFHRLPYFIFCAWLPVEIRCWDVRRLSHLDQGLLLSNTLSSRRLFFAFLPWLKWWLSHLLRTICWDYSRRRYIRLLGTLCVVFHFLAIIINSVMTSMSCSTEDCRRISLISWHISQGRECSVCIFSQRGCLVSTKGLSALSKEGLPPQRSLSFPTE